MPTLLAKISSNSALNGDFSLLDEKLNVLDHAANVTAYSTEVEAGKTYILVIIVTGDNGSKYKIQISGVASAQYPTSELTLDDNRDEIPALIVG